ncbi:MAG TPA: cellulase family glycosylhydrolase [bacterium]|nr:cellulase family glycosylhydrolase [bacterium]HPN43566.1 cellulase family glycosylhydrolase [bacterium]
MFWVDNMKKYKMFFLLLLALPVILNAQVQKPDYILSKGFFTLNGKIYDKNGYEVIMRGVNHTHTWGDGTKNFNSIPHIAKTGANVVRVCFSNWDWQTISNTPEKRRAIVESYIANGIAPMVELHEATCGESPSNIEAIIDNWLDPGNQEWLNDYEEYVILNIANEWGPGSNGDYSVWRDTYKTAISQLRDAGVNNMLVIDASGCGQDPNGIILNGQELIDHDPQHNVVLSIHFYGNWLTRNNFTGSGSTGVYTSSPWGVEVELSKMRDAGLPVIVGEFGWSEYEACPYITELILEFCQVNKIGWLAWSWNSNSDPLLDMVWDWAYNSDEDLREYGNVIINHPMYGLKTTAQPLSIFTHDKTKPSVLITFPADSAFITFPSELTITVDADDIDGSVDFVEFYNGLEKIGEDNSAPYSLTLPVISRGDHRLGVIAVDNDGNRTLADFCFITVGNQNIDKTALLVTANAATVKPGDTRVVEYLKLAGYNTIFVDDDTADAPDAANMDLVLISSTIVPTKVKDKFNHITIPIIVWEARLFDDLKMTDVLALTDYGTADGKFITIINPTHPLAAGLNNDVMVMDYDYKLTWGKPAPAAITVAGITGQSGLYSLFAYEKGADMFGLTAPARRVGLFLYDESGSQLNQNGWLLFDAALEWAGDKTVAVPPNEIVPAPAQIELAQNFPNPFNPETVLKFTLPQPGVVRMQIYDLNGRMVRNWGAVHYGAGEHQLRWNGCNDNGLPVPSGVYYCTLETRGQRLVNKMLLVK